MDPADRSLPTTRPLVQAQPGPAQSSRQLPLELEQMVIRCALSGLSPLEAQPMRVELSLVCRAWRDSIRPERHVVVVGNANVAKAGTHFGMSAADPSRDNDGDQVRSLLIQLRTRGTEPHARAVARLLGLVPNVERVELVAADSSLKNTCTVRSSLGEVVLTALAGLSRVREFAFGGEPDSADGPQLGTAELARLADAWPDLVYLDLGRARATDPFQRPSAPHPLAGNSKLTSLALGPSTQFSSTFTAVLDQLPSSVHTLVFLDTPLRQMPHLSALLRTALSPLLGQLRHLALLDSQTHRRAVPPIPRGAHDALLASATALDRLEISPCAVADLSASLGPLGNLAELGIIQGRYGSPAAPVTAAEVVAFLNSSGSIRRLTVSSNVQRKWSSAGRRDVYAAASARQVQFVIV